MILSGWKDIGRHCGNIRTVSTIKKLAKKYHMPIVYMNNRPFISESALEEWWNKLKEKLYPKK